MLGKVERARKMASAMRRGHPSTYIEAIADTLDGLLDVLDGRAEIAPRTMTLREHYAGLSLAALIANNEAQVHLPGPTALAAVEYADALIDALKENAHAAQ